MTTVIDYDQRPAALYSGGSMTRISAAGLLLGVAALAADIPSRPVTFNKDVLPILQRNCQSCHRPGQIGPMSLLTYQEAPPWAKSIRPAVAAKKMPPWFADPRSGQFSYERKPSDTEIA